LTTVELNQGYPALALKMPDDVKSRIQTLVLRPHRAHEHIDLGAFTALRQLELYFCSPGYFRSWSQSWSAVECLVTSLDRLQVLKMSNLSFPSDVIRAPNLRVLDARFTIFQALPGKFPDCPNIETLVMEVRSVLDLNSESQDAQDAQDEFASQVLEGGLRPWLSSCSRLQTLELYGDYSQEIFIEDLPPNVQALTLSGVELRVSREAGHVWESLRSKYGAKLQRLFWSMRASTNSGLAHHRELARQSLRDTVIVLRSHGSTK
jgi:hypothetical protein